MSEEVSGRYVKLGSLQMDMLWCPPGGFLMGRSEDEGEDLIDAPQHLVILSKGFWLGEFPVTQEEYDVLADMAGVPSSPSKFKGERHPVECVTWAQAAKWCQALTRRERAAHRLPEGFEYRLPTEAEWEYACRARTTTALNNGKILRGGDGGCDSLDEVAWYDKNSGKETHDVGGKLPNRWGFYDMHGNVEEWCWDWYGEYSKTAVTDPIGPETGKYRVCRGGNMGCMGMACSSSARKSGNVTHRHSYRGFRLCLGRELGISYEEAMASVRTGHDMDPQQKQQSEEELRQQRQEVEERLKVNRRYVEAIEGDASVQGSRNFTMDDTEIRMVWCPAGTFQMGSPEQEAGRSEDEQQHTVSLSRGFWIGMYELTQEEYSLLADAAGLRARPSNFAALRRPVEMVDYASAQRWCRELTLMEFISGRLPEGYVYRLPTEAEWEYACRAGTTTMFNNACTENEDEAGRQKFEDIGWYKYNSKMRPHFVGDLRPNPWGLYDMHGNVQEWCSDWYGEYSLSQVTDPVGSSEGEERVTRGGGFGDLARHCRSANRCHAPATAQKTNIGFRIVLGPALP